MTQMTPSPPHRLDAGPVWGGLLWVICVTCGLLPGARWAWALGVVVLCLLCFLWLAVGE